MHGRSSAARRRNRRKLTRYFCRQPEALPWIALLAPRTWPATVYDISPTGVGIILSNPITPGTKVKLELYNQADRSWQARIGQVIHCTPQDLHTWRIGFGFLQPFTEVELHQLLPASPTGEQARQARADIPLSPPPRSPTLGSIPADWSTATPDA